MKTSSRSDTTRRDRKGKTSLCTTRLSEVSRGSRSVSPTSWCRWSSQMAPLAASRPATRALPTLNGRTTPKLERWNAIRSSTQRLKTKTSA